MRVARKEGVAMAKREGNKRQRQKRLEEAEKKAAEKAAEIARLHDPALRLVTFSGLTIKLQSEGLKEQLRLRSVVDKRREDNGRALVLVPPTGEGGRSWFVRKLQALLKMEFAEKKSLTTQTTSRRATSALRAARPALHGRVVRRWRRPVMATRRRHPSRNSAEVVSGRP